VEVYVMQRSLSVRVYVAASSGLLARSILAPASSLAQDSPEGAVEAVFDALEEQRFDELGQYVCSDYREDAETMDSLLTEGLEGFGIDPQTYLDGLSISIDERVIETVEGGDAQAIVSVSAQLTAALDEAVARDLLRTMMGDFLEDVDDEQFESMVADMLESMATGSQLESEVEVVREDGSWLVCTDLAELMEGSSTDTEVDSVDTGLDSVEAVSADAICDLISLDELNGLGPLQYSVMDASVPGMCTYSSEEATSFHSLGLSVNDFYTLDSLRSFGETGEVRELTVDGRAAISVPDLYSLFVETGSDMLVVTVFGDFDEGFDHDYAVAVAEIALPRYVESDD
jgi:hypothetical protein